MVENLLKTYAPYNDHPQYEQVVNRMLISNFVAAAKRDRRVAVDILRRISPRFYSLKVARGCLHMLFPRKS
jgi:alpha-1,3-rhamnosyltransferase